MSETGPKRCYSTTSPAYIRKKHKEALVSFYEQHNRLKLPLVDYLLDKFQGRERELFGKLKRKYGVGESEVDAGTAALESGEIPRAAPFWTPSASLLAADGTPKRKEQLKPDFLPSSPRSESPGNRVIIRSLQAAAKDTQERRIERPEASIRRESVPSRNLRDEPVAVARVVNNRAGFRTQNKHNETCRPTVFSTGGWSDSDDSSVDAVDSSAMTNLRQQHTQYIYTSMRDDESRQSSCMAWPSRTQAKIETLKAKDAFLWSEIESLRAENESLRGELETITTEIHSVQSMKPCPTFEFDSTSHQEIEDGDRQDAISTFQEQQHHSSRRSSFVVEARVQSRLNEVLQRKICFKSGSDQIAPRSATVLQSLAEVLAGEDAVAVVIEGHTDSPNLPLSQKRAEAVKLALARCGIAANRMTAKGRSNKVPLFHGRSSKRVEIKVIGLPTRSGEDILTSHNNSGAAAESQRERERLIASLRRLDLGYALPRFEELDALSLERFSSLELDDFDDLGMVDVNHRRKLWYLIQRIRLVSAGETQASEMGPRASFSSLL